MEENKYHRGQIYKIVDNGYNMTYYGSTINRLCQRMALHRDHFRNGTLKCTVKKIFDEYGIENCKIELVESYPCNNRAELEAREGYYIKNNECVNRCVVGRKKKEYYQDNKDKIQAYYQMNKDKIQAYRQANKDEIKAYYQVNKDKIQTQQLAYRQANKDKINAQRRTRRQANKDKINAERRARYQAQKDKL